MKPHRDPEDLASDSSSRPRTRGRELAIKLLYLLDMRGPEHASEQVRRLASQLEDDREAREFALELYEGTSKILNSLDEVIKGIADNWDLTRMAFVDRAILRLGVFELLHRHDIPPKATISEALEIAKRFSTEKSSSFVNGILDKVFQDHCADKV